MGSVGSAGASWGGSIGFVRSVLGSVGIIVSFVGGYDVLLILLVSFGDRSFGLLWCAGSADTFSAVSSGSGGNSYVCVYIYFLFINKYINNIYIKKYTYTNNINPTFMLIYILIITIYIHSD